MAVQTLQVADRVQESSTTTGTGTFTLAGAASGYQSFASAFPAASTPVGYCIVDTAGNWEVGNGTYTLSGTTLSRGTILASSNAGAVVSFPAGTKAVFNSFTAAAIALVSPPTATSAWVNLSPAFTSNPTYFAFSNGNRTVQSGIGTSTPATCTAQTSHSSGKRYFEGVLTARVAVGGSNISFGIVSALATLVNNWSSIGSTSGDILFRDNGQGFGLGGAYYFGGFGAWSVGDVIGIAVDFTATTVAFYRNGTLQFTCTAGLMAAVAVPYLAFDSASTGTLRTRLAEFGYAPPAGFTAWEDANTTLTTKGDLMGYTGSALLRVPVGVTGQVPTADPVSDWGWSWKNGGLAYFIETLYATGTNATDNVDLLTLNVPSTNGWIGLKPKGQGGIFMGPQPDGTTTGGNARTTAINAVDLQMTRSAANQVNKGVRGFMGGQNNEIFNTNSNCDFLYSANCYLQGSGYNAIVGGYGHSIGPSGSYSASNNFIGGGNSLAITSNANNSALVSGGSSTIAGGSSNSIIGGNGHYIGGGNYNFIGGGRIATMSGGGSYNVSLGGFNNSSFSSSGSYNTQINCQTSPFTTSGSFNTMIGGASTTISGTASSNLVVGSSHLVDGASNSCSVFGYYGATRGVAGAIVHAYGIRAAAGDSQRRVMVLRGTTTNATPLALTALGGTASAANQINFPTSTTCAIKVKGQLTGIIRSTGAVVGYDFSAMVKQVTSTVSVVGTPTVTQQAADASLTGVVLAINADNTLKCVQVLVTGIAATTIDWVASIESVEAA